LDPWNVWNMLIETLEFIKLQIFGVSFIKYFKLVSPNLECKVFHMMLKVGHVKSFEYIVWNFFIPNLKDFRCLLKSLKCTKLFIQSFSFIKRENS